MAADAIELYLDLSTPAGALVTSLTDRTTPLFGPFLQGSKLNLRVFPVVATGNILGTIFSKVALDGLTFEFVIGLRAGTNVIYAAQYVWTAQNANDAEGKSGYWYATVDLNTTEMNNALTGESLTVYAEFRLGRGAAATGPVHQVTTTIYAAVKDPGAAASIPTPAAEYLTAAQCKALFVQWRNDLEAANAGRIIVLTSPDATKQREIGVGNDGSGIDNLV